MKIVIDIPEKTFTYYVTLANKGEQIGNLERIILDGTPLQKHHGRLIDADELEECKEIMTTLWGESKYAIRMDDIRNMPTIIEGSDSE